MSWTRIIPKGASWKTTRFLCKKCGGESLGSELAGGELSEVGIWQNCPKCDEPIVLLIFNAVHKLADHPIKEPAKTSSYWTLTFKRGESLTDASLASVLAGIETLDADNPKNDWMILEKHSANSEHLGFAQTAAMQKGFIIEIRIETPESSDLGFWKAGRREPPGSVVSESKKGRFKTFANEVLRIDEVKAIFEHFYQQFQLHPGFTWRSILDDFLPSIPDKSVPKMASCRYHLDPWKTTRFTCTKCGGEYLGSELTDGGQFEDGVERDCPKCHEPLLFLIFETVDELANHPEALAPDERENFARRSDFVKKWRAGILRSPEQLPDLKGKKSLFSGTMIATPRRSSFGPKAGSFGGNRSRGNTMIFLSMP